MSVTIFALMTVGQWFQVAFDVCFPALVYRILLYSMRVQVLHLRGPVPCFPRWTLLLAPPI